LKGFWERGGEIVRKSPGPKARNVSTYQPTAETFSDLNWGVEENRRKNVQRRVQGKRSATGLQRFGDTELLATLNAEKDGLGGKYKCQLRYSARGKPRGNDKEGLGVKTREWKTDHVGQERKHSKKKVVNRRVDEGNKKEVKKKNHKEKTKTY